MKRSTLAASGLTLGVTVIALVLFFTTPVGRFLQSNIFQSTYLLRDAGLYLGKEESTSTGKLLKADQGLRLRAAPSKVGATNVADVYMEVVNNSSSLTANSLKVVVSYDKDQLTVRDLSSITPMPGLTLDRSFSKILLNPDNTERGILYLGLDKTSDFLKPKDEVVSIRFEAKNANVRSANIALNTLRLYKRENLTEYTEPTLYIASNEGDNTVQQSLNIVFDGTYSVVTETALTGGGILRKEVLKDYGNNVLKTTETTYDTSGRITKVQTTYANGDSETAVYTYNTDGSYTVVTTIVKNGTTTTTTRYFNRNGIEQNGPTTQSNANTNGNANNNGNTNTNANSNSNGNTNTNANANTNGNSNVNSNANTNKTTTTTSTGTIITNTNTNGVTIAVTNTNTNTTTTVNTNSATTTTTPCVAPASERFNDTVGHWSEAIVEQARQKCIISGKALGRFAPDEPVTRAELTKIAVEAFKVASASGTTGFSDVSDSEWYATYVKAAKLAQIVNGYGDGSFKPNNSVNRAEALKIILEAGAKTGNGRSVGNLDGTFSNWLSTHPTYTYVQFPDVKVADWFGKYVLTGFQQSVVSGYYDRGTTVFRPGQPVTRAEAVKIIMSIIQ